MPELPEVETVRRGLLPAFQNNHFKTITLNRRTLRNAIDDNFEEALTNACVIDVVRRGKYIIVLCDNGHGFVLHLGMSGRIRIYPDYTADAANVPQKHDHVVFDMNDGHRVIFNDARRFGMLYLTHAATWTQEKPFSAMGAEPLSNALNARHLLDKLRGKKTNIKTALLDQRVIAGVGNIYACEALYYARISPRRAARTITAPEAEKLCVCIRDVLNKAITAGGSSLRDHVKTDGSLGYFQTQWAVYGRAGQACRTCNADVIKIPQNGRTTFFCAVCQK